MLGYRAIAGCALAAVLAALAAAAPASARFFQSPDGNVGCFISEQNVRCDIRKRDWEPPPKPDSCEFDWGHGLVVDETGRGRFVCTSDTALNPEAPPLPLGQPIERDEFRCRSKQTGMRCINQQTKHGFKLSRKRAKRF